MIFFNIFCFLPSPGVDYLVEFYSRTQPHRVAAHSAIPPASATGAARNNAHQLRPRQQSRAHPELRDNVDGEPPTWPRNRVKTVTVAVATILLVVQIFQVLSLHDRVVTVTAETGLAPVAHNKESYDVKNIKNNDIRMKGTGYASNDTTVVKEREKNRENQPTTMVEPKPTSL